jgi:hypothetical protein
MMPKSKSTKHNKCKKCKVRHAPPPGAKCVNEEVLEQHEASINILQSSSNKADMFLMADEGERSGLASVVGELKNRLRALLYL